MFNTIYFRYEFYNLRIFLTNNLRIYQIKKPYSTIIYFISHFIIVFKILINTCLF